MKGAFLSFPAALLFLTMCSKAEPEKAVTEFSDLPQREKTEIKVMSSNVRNSMYDTQWYQLWKNRANAYIAMLSDTQPDIIGLQEFNDAVAADLSVAAEYELYRVTEYDGSDPTVTDEQLPANAVMFRKSRFDLLDRDVFYYNEQDPSKPCHYPMGASGWQVRGCLWVKLSVKATGSLVYFFATHYTHDPTEIIDPDTGAKHYNIEERRKASELAVAQIEKIVTEKDAAVFLVGDLNCSLKDGATRNGPRSLEPLSEYMWSAREEAALSDGGISYNGFQSPETDGQEEYSKAIGNIDFIWFRGADALDFRTVNGHGYGVYFVSDHYPVTCTFRF